MSITISEVLSLHMFKNHTLLAGQSGTKRMVKSVGIVDNFALIRKNYALFSNSHLQERLLLSTCFVTFVPEDQMECLRFLQNTGASGLVLLQNDLIEGCAAPEALRLADELNFPVIQSPNQYPSYSELIVDVMRAITSKNVSMSISPALKWLKSSGEEGQTMEQLLQLITESANLYIGLYDWNLNLIYASAPVTLLEHTQYRNMLLAQVISGSFHAQNGEFFFKRTRLNSSHDLLSYVVLIARERSTIDSISQQITDIIRLFTSIHYKPAVNYSALGNALLSGDLVLARHYAGLLSAKIEDLRFLVFCPVPGLPKNDKASALLAELEKFCVQNSIAPIINREENGLLLFFRKPVLESELVLLLEEFSSHVQSKPGWKPFPRFFITVLETPASAKTNYAMCLKHAGSIERVFPHKSVFSHQQLLFVENIIVPFQNSPDTLQYIENILSPLKSSQGRQLELIDTLSTYMLDANGNLDLAANILMLHKSTVKYRVGRANELLDCDIRKMPESYNLYLALAVARLLK